MNTTDLLRFVSDTGAEYQFHENEGAEDVLLFVDRWNIEDFTKLFRDIDDEGIDCKMKKHYFCFWMRDICECNGIEIEDVFKRDK